MTQIIRDVVNPLGPGLTESFVPSLNRLNIGLDIDTIIQVGSNMTKSVLNGVMTLNATAMGWGRDQPAGCTGRGRVCSYWGAKIKRSGRLRDPTTYTINTSALNASEVNDRIDNRLPTVTSFEASDENGYLAPHLDLSARGAEGEHFRSGAHRWGCIAH